MNSWKDYESDFLRLILPREREQLRVKDGIGVMKMMEFHKTGGIAFQNIKDGRILLKDSPRLYSYLENEYNVNLLRNTIISEMLDVIAEDFSNVRAFKGGSLLRKVYAGRSGMRFMSDLDLICPPEDIDPLLMKLKSDGFIPSGSVSGEKRKGRSHITLSGNKSGMKLQIELHWRLFEIATDMEQKLLESPGALAALHLIYHYYVNRVYHILEWGLMKNEGIFSQADRELLSEMGFRRDLDITETLYENLKEYRVDNGFFRHIFRMNRNLNMFERVHFWIFVQRKIKISPGYMVKRMKRGVRW
ncbi:nucleotidyltransferase family protein [bacterium]|nr:nucleotidyltransferase family protein [bacterium]